MTKTNHQAAIQAISGTNPIAYNPALARMLKSSKAGLLLSQLLFWCNKGRNPNWIYKTVDEMKRETGLSRDEQSTAIKACKKLGVMETKLGGVPAKRNFKINLEKIREILKSTEETPINHAEEETDYPIDELLL